MEEAGEETIPKVEEETSQEEDATTVPQMSLVEERIRTQVIQVVTGLINKKINLIIMRNLFIMHMNAGRINITMERKSKTNHHTRALRRAQC